MPVTFGVDRLDARLIESGYDCGAKTLFIIEGLLMYIHPYAVDALLSFISRSAATAAAGIEYRLTPGRKAF